MDPPRKKKKIIRIDNFFKSCSDVESCPTTNSSVLSSQETASAQAVVEDATVVSSLLTEKPYQPEILNNQDKNIEYTIETEKFHRQRVQEKRTC